MNNPLIECGSIIGLTFAFLSSIFFVVNSTIIQITGLSGMTVAWWCCTGIFLILIPITTYRYIKEKPNADLFGKINSNNIPVNFFWLTLRGVLGATSLWMGNTTVTMLPVGDASCLFQTGLIWATLISWIWLKEKAPFFRRDQSSVQNLTTKIFFSNHELHIVLKGRNI